MKRSDLLAQITLGEDSTRQFKADVKNADSLASEMAAFANTNGGTIFIGVADDGSTPELSGQDVARINQLISNGASQLVRSPLAVQTENVALKNGRIIIALTVPKGIDKLDKLEKWPDIDFADDHDGCLFSATVHWKAVEELELVNIAPEGSLKSSPKTEDQILELMRGDASITTEQLGGILGITKRAVLKQVEKLKGQGRLRRVGPAKGGYWEVIE